MLTLPGHQLVLALVPDALLQRGRNDAAALSLQGYAGAEYEAPMVELPDAGRYFGEFAAQPPELDFQSRGVYDIESKVEPGEPVSARSQARIEGTIARIADGRRTLQLDKKATSEDKLVFKLMKVNQQRGSITVDLKSGETVLTLNGKRSQTTSVMSDEQVATISASLLAAYNAAQKPAVAEVKKPEANKQKAKVNSPAIGTPDVAKLRKQVLPNATTEVAKPEKPTARAVTPKATAKKATGRTITPKAAAKEATPRAKATAVAAVPKPKALLEVTAKQAARN